MATELQETSWAKSAAPPPKPPVTAVGPVGWLRANLFSSVGNSLLTLFTLAAIYFGGVALVRWILNAFWTPVWENRKLFAVGPYPNDELLRPLIVLLVLTLLFGVSAGRWGSLMRSLAIGLGALLATLAILPIGATTQLFLGGALALLIGGYVAGLRVHMPSRLLVYAWIAGVPFTLIMLAGGISLGRFNWQFMTAVPTNLWGGLMVTLLLAVVGIALSFPIGVLLALGRRSDLPVVRYFCIAYIETIRGAPLITLLFTSMVLLPLFLPATFTSPPAMVRVVVAITLFSAAYLAENVRGGLQAIPKGQYEAADALGLSTVDKYRLIILPQALAKVIPAIVGQFISLFKDTSLVALVGIPELLGVARAVIQQPTWLGVPGGITKEVYLFTALVYFIFSYGMSVASRRLEASLGVGKR